MSASVRLPRIVGTAEAGAVRSFAVDREAVDWTRTDEVAMFRAVLGTATTIVARVSVLASSGAGSEVLIGLGVGDDGPRGRPRVEPLPDEFGEGAIVQHAVVAADGALSVAIDMVVERGETVVVVTSGAIEPQWTDAAAVALVRLLLAVRVGT
jgi:hypothetical protein